MSQGLGRVLTDNDQNGIWVMLDNAWKCVGDEFENPFSFYQSTCAQNETSVADVVSSTDVIGIAKVIEFGDVDTRIDHVDSVRPDTVLDSQLFGHATVCDDMPAAGQEESHRNLIQWVGIDNVEPMYDSHDRQPEKKPQETGDGQDESASRHDHVVFCFSREVDSSPKCMYEKGKETFSSSPNEARNFRFILAGIREGGNDIHLSSGGQLAHDLEEHVFHSACFRRIVPSDE